LAEQGKLSPVPQNHEEHTYAKMLTKAMGEISFEQSAVVIERLIRGLNPWPSAYTHLDNKLLKIWDADVVESQGDFVPGQVSSVQKNGFTVRTGQGDLQIHSLQLEGKKRMDAESFLRGFPLKTGQQLG
jgi:methionyl-tRNA formyltransferase